MNCSPQSALAGQEGSSEFATVSADWGEQFILHLAVDAANPDRMFAATRSGQVLASKDRGRTWAAFGAQ
jgi:hypothetical protein